MPHAADIGLSRRTFLGVACRRGADVGTPGAARAGPAGRTHLPQVSDDPVALARAPAARLQRGATARGTDRRRRIARDREAFKAEDVVIAEVGAWRNMLDPDPAKRAENLATSPSGCALADAVAARCCVDIAGSFNPTVWYGPHPKNLSQEFFDATVENCRKVIDAVKPKRTTFTIEMMGWSLPDGPDAYLRADPRRRSAGVRRAHGRVQRHQLAAAVLRQRRVHPRVLREARPWIVSCHAKDLAFIPEMNVHFTEVIPGTRPDRLRDLPARAVGAPGRRAADARAPARRPTSTTRAGTTSRRSAPASASRSRSARQSPASTALPRGEIR